jgi:hypothetical protein
MTRCLIYYLVQISITIRHGPLDVEIQAEESEEYQQEVLDLLDFIETNQTRFEDLSSAPIEADIPEITQAPADTDMWEEEEARADEGGSNLSDISRRTGVDQSVLERLFDIPEDIEETPAIIIEEFEDGIDVFGTSRRERQARASLVLLYVWQQVRQVDEVPSSELGDALHMSGIDPDNMYAMYDALGGDADAYFNRTSGGTPTVTLSRRGERAAIDELQELVGRL